MAANFRMIRRRKKNNLHLKLSGDFDGMSAMELLNVLEENADTAKKIFIETDGICTMLPFGRDVFLKNFAISMAASNKLIFKGDPGQKIAPRGAFCINENHQHQISNYPN